MNKWLVVWGALLILSAPLQAKDLQLLDILQQVVDSHPKTRAMLEQGVMQRAEKRKAEAAFDPYFSQKLSGRVSGYYDGHVLTSQVTKPLAGMGAEVFARYQLADGRFPVYEGFYDTLSGGEASVGIALSLLRGRETDERRTNLQTAALDIQLWQAQYQGLLNDQLYLAASTYLKWYESSLKRQALEAMSTTLRNSGRALQQRVEQGDAAQMDLDDFTSSTLEVSLLQTDTEQAQAVAVAKLQDFISEPAPLAIPGTTRQQWPFSVNDTRLRLLKQSLATHPLQLQMGLSLQNSQAQLQLAKNNLLPVLDVKASVGRDIGQGNKTLQGTETKVGLDFSYPIGNRKNQAEQHKAQAKVRQNQLKIADLNQKLEQQFEAAVARWKQSQQALALRQQAQTLAERLQRAQLARFNSGDTDMFVLNARQTKLIKAQMEAISAHVDQRQAELDLFYAAAALDSLALVPNTQNPVFNEPERRINF